MRGVSCVHSYDAAALRPPQADAPCPGAHAQRSCVRAAAQPYAAAAGMPKQKNHRRVAAGKKTGALGVNAARAHHTHGVAYGASACALRSGATAQSHV